MKDLGQAVSCNFPYHLTDRQAMLACNTIDRNFRACMSRVAFIPQNPHSTFYIYSSPEASVCLSWTKRTDNYGTEVKWKAMNLQRVKE